MSAHSLEVKRLLEVESVMIRFRSYVRAAGPNDCWEWAGEVLKRRGGYGAFWVSGKRYRAHRVAYFYETGEWPDLHICHQCDNRICCNPRHLFPGTARDNVYDAIHKGRLQFAHLPHGHNIGERNGNARLTPEIVREIRAADCSTRGSVVALARKYGLAQSAVSNIRNGLRWRHVL